MLNAKAFAHAVTAVTAVVYVICRLLSVLVPDLLFGLSQAWVHTLSLESMKTNQAISFGTEIVGLVALALLAWVTTYATIWLYNRWAGGAAR